MLKKSKHFQITTENRKDVKYESEKARDEDVTHPTWPENIVKQMCNG